MKIFLIGVIAVCAMTGCVEPKDKAAIQALFDKCMEQSKNMNKTSFGLLDTSEDVIMACEGYAQRNA